MSVSMFEASVPVFIAMLSGTAHVLKKAEANAEERKIDPLIFTSARHVPDMFPMSRQIQIATDQAKGCASRLAGRDVPSWEDTEKTFDELQARIARTIDYLGTFSPEEFEGSEDKTITMKIAGNDMEFPGRAYLFGFVHPNFYFHITTAYTILRAQGVPLGKMDYFGRG